MNHGFWNLWQSCDIHIESGSTFEKEIQLSIENSRTYQQWRYLHRPVASTATRKRLDPVPKNEAPVMELTGERTYIGYDNNSPYSTGLPHYIDHRSSLPTAAPMVPFRARSRAAWAGEEMDGSRMYQGVIGQGLVKRFCYWRSSIKVRGVSHREAGSSFLTSISKHKPSSSYLCYRNFAHC
jgi:hypothetical protein